MYKNLHDGKDPLKRHDSSLHVHTCLTYIELLEWVQRRDTKMAPLIGSTV